MAETRLLLATLAPAGPGAVERVRSAAGEVRDWPQLLRLAGRHEVVALLHRGLAEAAYERLPAGILALLEDTVRRQRDLGRRAWDELRELLARFDSVGLAVMPFKGPVLARLLYDDFGARVSHDLDFLVRAADVPRVLAAIEAAGYTEPLHARLTPAQAAAMRALYGELAFVHPGRMTIEPHWALAQSTQSIDLDCEEMWTRARSVRIDGVELTVPAPEDLFLILVVHGSKEVWRRAKWVADLVAFLRAEPTLDWALVIDRARRAGILRMVHVGWLLAERAVAVEIPDAVRRSVEHDREADRLASQIEGRLLTGDTDAPAIDRLSRFRWGLRERRRDRWRYAWRTLTTPRPRHFRMVRLPDRLIGAYVPLKIVHDYMFAPLVRLLRGTGGAPAS